MCQNVFPVSQVLPWQAHPSSSPQTVLWRVLSSLASHTTRICRYQLIKRAGVVFFLIQRFCHYLLRKQCLTDEYCFTWESDQSRSAVFTSSVTLIVSVAAAFLHRGFPVSNKIPPAPTPPSSSSSSKMCSPVASLAHRSWATNWPSKHKSASGGILHVSRLLVEPLTKMPRFEGTVVDHCSMAIENEESFCHHLVRCLWQ